MVVKSVFTVISVCKTKLLKLARKNFSEISDTKGGGGNQFFKFGMGEKKGGGTQIFQKSKGGNQTVPYCEVGGWV